LWLSTRHRLKRLAVQLGHSSCTGHLRVTGLIIRAGSRDPESRAEMTANCARRSPGEVAKDAGSIPAGSTIGTPQFRNELGFCHINAVQLADYVIWGFPPGSLPRGA